LLKPTDPHHNRSGLARFLPLHGIEYYGEIRAGLVLLEPIDGLTDYLAGFAFLSVMGELLHLLGPRQPALLERAVDF
jgi:hypothetical protein